MTIAGSADRQYLGTVTTASAPPAEAPPGVPSFASGEGECAALVRSLDWARTPLGPMAQWPPALQAAVAICLSSDLPLMVCWGPELVQIYNDAYRQLMGTKHPAGMGQPAEACWPEIAGFMMPLLRGVLEEGRRSRLDDQPLPLTRLGFLEEAYFDIADSPIRDAGGAIGGVFHSSIETTREVIGRRRLRALQLAASALRGLAEPAAVPAAALRLFEDSAADVPAALVVQAGADGAAVVAGAVGLRAPPAALPLPFARLAEVAAPDAAPLPPGALGLAPAEGRPPLGPARVVSLEGASREPVLLVLLASARRPFDGEYRAFLDLLGAEARSGLADAARVAELERAVRVRDEFISVTAHELRTPVAALGLRLGLVEKRLAGSPASERVAAVRRQLDRVSRVVEDLVEVSRVTTGGLTLDLDRHDLTRVVTGVVLDLQDDLARAECPVKLRLAPTAPAVFDRARVVRALKNVLSNAIKFGRGHPVEIEAGVDDGEVRIAVIDHGPGVDPAERERIFDRFARAVSDRHFGGLGLGLWLTRVIAEAHGGAIEVQDTPGGGATFVLRWPAEPGQGRLARIG